MCTVLHGVTSDSHGDDGTGGSCYKKLPSWLELIKLDNSMTGRLVFPEPGEDYAKYNFVWNLRFKSYVFSFTHILEGSKITSMLSIIYTFFFFTDY